MPIDLQSKRTRKKDEQLPSPSLPASPTTRMRTLSIASASEALGTADPAPVRDDHIQFFEWKRKKGKRENAFLNSTSTSFDHNFLATTAIDTALFCAQHALPARRSYPTRAMQAHNCELATKLRLGLREKGLRLAHDDREQDEIENVKPARRRKGSPQTKPRRQAKRGPVQEQVRHRPGGHLRRKDEPLDRRRRLNGCL